MTAAPIAPELLASAVAPHGESTMLPRQAYVDPAVLEWEKQAFFGGWVAIARSEDISGAVTQKAIEVDGKGVLLMRDEDGVLRGFANACRHRAHELLPCGGTGSRRMISCPYHAWSYDLAGKLKNAPTFQDNPHFDKTKMGLNELPVAEWHGWVFVAPSGVATDFADHVGNAEAVVAPYGAEGLRLVDTHDYVIEANWKLIVENYQECYHCPSIHPELCRVSPPDSGDNVTERTGDWMGGWMELREGMDTMSMDGTSGSVAIATLTEKELHSVMYLVLFPNMLISLHPDYVMTHTLVPLTETSTHVTCSWYFPQEAIASETFNPTGAVDFWDITNRQDWAACESVQRGLRSEQWTPGPLAPAEDGVYHFVSTVANRYLHG